MQNQHHDRLLTIDIQIVTCFRGYQLHLMRHFKRLAIIGAKLCTDLFNFLLFNFFLFLQSFNLLLELINFCQFLFFLLHYRSLLNILQTIVLFNNSVVIYSHSNFLACFPLTDRFDSSRVTRVNQLRVFGTRNKPYRQSCYLLILFFALIFTLCLNLLSKRVNFN